jgi:ABC-type multidrug transport system ATPase subunit
MGPDGAGKTTLLKQIVGLTRPDGGQIIMSDRLIKPGMWVKEHVTYLPQDPLALSDLTPGETVYATAVLRGLDGPHARLATAAIMEMLELHQKKRLIARLSGGERRLVGLATALVASYPDCGTRRTYQ